MVACQLCKKEMTDDATASCEKVPIEIDGKNMDPIPWESLDGHRCGDCNVAPGGFHHPGCDQERCPKCGLQLIGCDCLMDNAETH